MKHPDDDNELFHRLEADMAADSGGDVVDLDKARFARTGSADPTARRLSDLPTTKAAGPGYLGRLLAAKRRPVVPLWLKSVAELKTATAWVAPHYAHSGELPRAPLPGLRRTAGPVKGRPAPRSSWAPPCGGWPTARASRSDSSLSGARTQPNT